jgi:hypothetical protein
MVGDPVQPVGASPFPLFRIWLADLTTRRVGLAQEGVRYAIPDKYRLDMAQWIDRRNLDNHRGGGTNPSSMNDDSSVAAIARQLANIDFGQQPQQIHHALGLGDDSFPHVMLVRSFRMHIIAYIINDFVSL